VLPNRPIALYRTCCSCSVRAGNCQSLLAPQASSRLTTSCQTILTWSIGRAVSSVQRRPTGQQPHSMPISQTHTALQHDTDRALEHCNASPNLLCVVRSHPMLASYAATEILGFLIRSPQNKRQWLGWPVGWEFKEAWSTGHVAPPAARPMPPVNAGQGRGRWRADGGPAWCWLVRHPPLDVDVARSAASAGRPIPPSPHPTRRRQPKGKGVARARAPASNSRPRQGMGRIGMPAPPCSAVLCAIDGPSGCMATKGICYSCR
jgi:hypothetical protein